MSTGHTHLLSSRGASASSSAIRDLLDHARRPGMISLAGGLPDANLFPMPRLADLAAEVIRSDGRHALQYGTTRGERETRTALATLYDDTEPDRLIVTTGSQQALDLLARVLLDPGDVVLCGDPDYVGALQVMRSHGVALAPIRIDAHGIDTEVMADRLAAGLRPKACYVVPHFHNPTGATLAPQRRRHLLELSSRYGFVVIEDDPYRDLYYDGDIGRAGESDPELTVRLRSTSKILAPGLRIGVMEAPSWLREPVVLAKQTADLHTSTLTQKIAASALSAPWFPEHIGLLRSTYGGKRDVLVSSIQRALGDGVEFVAPGGGMFLWIDMGAGVDTTRLLESTLEQGMCFVPGSAFAVDSDLSTMLRLSFTTASDDDLREGAARLARSLALQAG